MDSSGTHVWLVLTKAFRAMRRHAERSLGGMNLSDFAILELLLNRGPHPVNAIGQRLRLTSGSITAAVDRLEERGLVVRSNDPDDRRTRIVSLTPEGKRTISKIFGHHKQTLDRAAEGLTKTEREILITLMKKLGRYADAAFERTT